MIAKPGLQPMPSTPGSSSRISARCDPRSSSSVVLLASFRDELTRVLADRTRLGRRLRLRILRAARRAQEVLHALRLTCRPMTEFPLTGGCLCGGVRFSVSEPPVSSSYCPARAASDALGRRRRRPRGSSRAPHHPLRRGAAPLVRPSGPRLLEVLLLGMRRAPVEPEPGGSRDQEHPPRRVRFRSRDPAVVPAVRRLRGVMGADPGRRAPPLSGASQRLSYCTSDPGQVSVRR